MSQSSLAAPLPSRIKLTQASPEHSLLSIRVISAALGGLTNQIVRALRISADRGVPALPLWAMLSPAPTGATPHFQRPSITRQRLLCCVLHMSSWFDPVSKRPPSSGRGATHGAGRTQMRETRREREAVSSSWSGAGGVRLDHAARRRPRPPAEKTAGVRSGPSQTRRRGPTVA